MQEKSTWNQLSSSRLTNEHLILKQENSIDKVSSHAIQFYSIKGAIIFQGVSEENCIMVLVLYDSNHNKPRVFNSKPKLALHDLGECIN